MESITNTPASINYSPKDAVEVNIYPRAYREERKSIASSYLDVVVGVVEDVMDETTPSPMPHPKVILSNEKVVATMNNSAVTAKLWVAQNIADLPAMWQLISGAEVLAIINNPVTKIWCHSYSKGEGKCSKMNQSPRIACDLITNVKEG